jgi:hypothetical protein
MEEYMKKEAEAQNATANMAERIALRKRELAEKKAKEVCVRFSSFRGNYNIMFYCKTYLTFPIFYVRPRFCSIRVDERMGDISIIC